MSPPNHLLRLGLPPLISLRPVMGCLLGRIIPCPTPALPKSDIYVWYVDSMIFCRIWGGCPNGRVGLKWIPTMPPKRSSPKTMHRAGELRKELTPAERKLWLRLRLLREDGFRFRRQHAIGPFITDFCALRNKIVIELDGSQHLDLTEYDSERTAFLESKGYVVLRFWNNEVMKNVDAVLGVIMDALHHKRLTDV